MPLLLPIVRRNGAVDFLIALDEESLARIREHDPFEIMWSQLPSEYSLRRPKTIGITFVSQQEQAEIERMSTTDPDWKQKAFDLLTRGFKYKPEAGDHDFGPVVLGEPTEGKKQ